MDDRSALADDLGEMCSQSVDESRSPASIAGIDEQALLDAQARLALAVAALDRAAEALVEAGLEPADCEPIGRSRAALDEMQRFLALSLDRSAPTIPRSVAITDLVEATREAAMLTARSDGPPDVDSALALLFGDCGIGDLETDTGKRLTALVEYRIGGLVTVSTDHGLVGTGARLSGSIVDEAGAPWRVDLRVESERERGDRTHLALRPEAIHHLERHAPAELEIGGSATLEAMECGGLYEGAEVLGRVVGLSATGVTFATLKPLRTGDRLRFHGRFFSEEVRAVVRVVSVDAEIEGGGMMVSCLFVEIDDDGRLAIDRVLDHALHPDAPISYSQLRLLTHGGPERRRGVRGLLRR
jgi:hypothetical protein